MELLREKILASTKYSNECEKSDRLSKYLIYSFYK